MSSGWGSSRVTKREAFVGTKSDAEARLRDLAGDAHRGALPTAGTATVDDLFAKYLADAKDRGIRLRTLRRYDSLARVHISPVIGSMLVSKVRKDHIRQVLARAKDAGLSERSRLHIYRVVAGAFGFAVRDLDWLTVSPVAGVRAPSAKRAKLTIPTYADVAKLIDAAVDDRSLRVAVVLAAGCGLRRGEALALRWSDVDWDKGEPKDKPEPKLTVRRALVNDGHVLSFAEPKTDKGVRTIPLPPPVVAALAEAPGIGDGLVISEGGQPVHPDTLSQRFARLAAKVAPGVRFHDLRHRYASELAEHPDLVPTKTAADHLGHSTVSFFLDTYVHPNGSSAAGEVIGAAMEGGN